LVNTTRKKITDTNNKNHEKRKISLVYNGVSTGTYLLIATGSGMMILLAMILSAKPNHTKEKTTIIHEKRAFIF
jgi:hypothetical protein